MGTMLSKVRLSGRQVACLVLLTLAASVAEMMLPTILATMIDTGVKSASRGFLISLGIVMAVMATVSCAANVAGTRISARISSHFAADLRREIFYKVQDLSSSEIDHFGTASLVTRSTSDVTNVQSFLTLLLRMGIMAPLMAIAGLVLSSATGGKVSSVLNTAIPVLLIVSVIILVAAGSYSTKMRKMIDRINTLFLETLEGVRVIRAFNKQETEIARFGDANASLSHLMVGSGRLTGALMPAITAIFGVTTTAVMALGSVYVSQGQMEVGALVANSQYISMILMSIIMLAAVIMMLPNALTCANRIAEVLAAESSLKDGDKTLADKTASATVEFRNVSFVYPGAEEPVLQNISFTAKPGEVTAIIGRTGCGKSSLVKLVPRLYDATVGHIFVDGIDVRDYAIADLRSVIGYVPQKNVLFSGDIASNLNFGKENGTDEDWERAARISCADEFIARKADGFHEHIAQGGTNLSGGQRQRLAIARAVMKQPEVYLFDDSFSALDMKTDRQLRQNLREAAGDATIIMVAQRIGTILDADRIIVLEDGEVAGMGTHRELLRDCPMYREMAELQLGKEAVENE
jgi:ATP-binding cassette subfamily B protein